MDLRAAVADNTVGCRRLLVLIGNLPPDAAFHRDGQPWGDTEHLLAIIADLLGTGFELKTTDGKAFKVPRPGETQDKAAPAAVDTMKSLIGGG